MLRSWAQLLRIPNVFTAPPDVLAGAVLTLGAWPDAQLTPLLIQLCLASCCLYLAGMVLNDVFDLEEDRRDRPFRPLPSGRIRRGTAAVVGVVLLFLGIALAVTIAGPALHPQWPIPLILAGLIVLYNAWAKRTFLGPWVMGACRGCNVLLGTLVAETSPPLPWWAAVTVTLYITGLTVIARNEVRGSEWGPPGIGAGLMVTALTSLALLLLRSQNWPLPPLLALVWGYLLFRSLARLSETWEPAQVQAAIKAFIFGLVALEAIHASIVVGVSGLLLLLFLPPALLLGRWVYST
jgi:hypothetical protein